MHLERNWAKDQMVIQKNLQRAMRDDGPLWLTIFPVNYILSKEGTVICDETVEASKNYALKTGLKEEPKHVVVSFI